VTGDELDAFARGDPAAFRALVARETPRLLGLALSYTRDLDDAHDRVQATWIRAYQERAAIRSPDGVGAWLLSICRNECLAAGRRHARRAALLRAGYHGEEHAAEPGDPAARSELGGRLLEALDELPERQRQVFVLRMVEGRSTRGAADIMGCAEGTAKAALHAAVKKLREAMKPWNE
jgi:RNA polymerase sigma-70 factor (ECF subfamily)